MTWQGAAIGAGIQVIGGLFGGSRAASAAQQEAIAKNEATMARYQYDLDMWSMKKKQLISERQESIDRILANARNEGRIRAYKDAQAEQQYNYSLMIRNEQQLGNERAYQRSEDIYTDTINLNSLSAKAAMDSEIIKLQESQDERAFSENTLRLEQLQAEGKLRATGASGRTASKNVQSTLADYGRQMEMLNATDDSESRNTRAVLEEIIRDKTSADLTAYASKMLKPGQLPKPLKAAPIPIPEYTLPRVLSSYDFGPQPVKGAMASPGAAASAAWGSAITSIAGSVGDFASGWSHDGASGWTYSN